MRGGSEGHRRWPASNAGTSTGNHEDARSEHGSKSGLLKAHGRSDNVILASPLGQCMMHPHVHDAPNLYECTACVKYIGTLPCMHMLTQPIFTFADVHARTTTYAQTHLVGHTHSITLTQMRTNIVHGTHTHTHTHTHSLRLRGTKEK